MAEIKTSLILVDKNKLWLYAGATGEILSLDIPTTMMKDMEILNHELFIKQFESFITVHSISGSNLGLVLATPLLFVKDFSGMEEVKKEEAIRLFIENVPFDSVAQTRVHVNKVVRVIAANKDLIMLLKRSLEKQLAKVVIAVPATVVPSLGTTNSLDSKTALSIIAQLDSLKIYSLLDAAPAQSQLLTITEGAADKVHPKRLPLLLGTFGGLISLLIGVAVVSNSQPTVPPSRAANIATAVSSPVKAVSSIETVRLDLIRNDQSASISSQLKTALQTGGMVDVRELADSAVPPSSSQIIFSSSVAVSVQGQIINIVKAIEPSFSTKVVTGLGRDVEIRLK